MNFLSVPLILGVMASGFDSRANSQRNQAETDPGSSLASIESWNICTDDESLDSSIRRESLLLRLLNTVESFIFERDFHAWHYTNG